MKKALTSLLCLILTAVLLSSCGGESSPVGKTDSGNTDNTSENLTDSGVGRDSEKISAVTEQNTESSDATEKHTDEKNTESEKHTEKITEKVTEKATEKQTDEQTEKVTEKVTEKTTESSGDDIISGYIPETQNYGHYHNNINAYYSGNILVCGDYAVEYFSSNKNGNQSYADAVNAFAKKYPDISVTALLTPKACAYISPDGYNNTLSSQKAFIEATYAMLNDGIKTADCEGELTKHDGEYLFYRTDHHWTSLGAYYASVAYCKANGITPTALDDYTVTVGGDYVGSLYSFCDDPKPSCLQNNPDHSVAHVAPTAYTMTYISGGKTYNGTAVNTNAVSYASMFICGDQPLTHIVTENKNGRKLLVFKESYGNAFVPYMIDYFEEIVAIDFRKDTASVQSIINEYGITDALMINNVQSAVSLAGSFASKLAS